MLLKFNKIAFDNILPAQAGIPLHQESGLKPPLQNKLTHSS